MDPLRLPLLAVLIALAALALVAGDDGLERLRGPEAFASIADSSQRSAAFFTEAGKVILHPRCVNCHPSGDRPLVGEDSRLHEPPVHRGALDFGVPGMFCNTCHQDANFDPARVPGDPHWQLAPIEAAWEGKSLAEICAQLKDPARNGGRDLEKIAEHNERDPLVGWAWAPGAGRRPAPGSQKLFGELIRAWIETGAVCPAP